MVPLRARENEFLAESLSWVSSSVWAGPLSSVFTANCREREKGRGRQKDKDSEWILKFFWAIRFLFRCKFNFLTFSKEATYEGNIEYLSLFLLFWRDECAWVLLYLCLDLDLDLVHSNSHSDHHFLVLPYAAKDIDISIPNFCFPFVFLFSNNWKIKNLNQARNKNMQVYKKWSITMYAVTACSAYCTDKLR